MKWRWYSFLSWRKTGSKTGECGSGLGVESSVLDKLHLRSGDVSSPWCACWEGSEQRSGLHPTASHQQTVAFQPWNWVSSPRERESRAQRGPGPCGSPPTLSGQVKVEKPRKCGERGGHRGGFGVTKDRRRNGFQEVLCQVLLSG